MTASNEKGLEERAARRKNEETYWGNRFYSIPISTDSNMITISGIHVVKVHEPLKNAINLINDRYANGEVEYSKRNKGINISRFTKALNNLYYPIIASQSNFKSNDGEWLYMMEDFDKELLIYHFKNWCMNRIDDKEYGYLKKYIDNITVEVKDIVFPLNPHTLTKKEQFYLYSLLPCYLVYIASGKLKVDVKAQDGNKVSKFDFYKMQNETLRPEMISLPFKASSRGDRWTYTLDVSVKTVKGINSPFINLSMSTTRVIPKIPSSNKYSYTAIISSRMGSSYEAYKLKLRKDFRTKPPQWGWGHDISSGLKSASLEAINAIPDEILYDNATTNDVTDTQYEVGIVCDSKTARLSRHSVATGTSEYDEFQIYDKLLAVIRSEDTKTNVLYGDFLTIENTDSKKTYSRKGNDRFEQLQNKITINAYYATDDWLRYLIDSIFVLFNGKRAQDYVTEPNKNILMDAMLFSQADKVEFNKDNMEFNIVYKGKQTTIALNLISIKDRRECFRFESDNNEYNDFKSFLDRYLIDNCGETIQASLFELEREEEFDNLIDPKPIIRNLLASHKSISQFIAFQDKPYIDVAFGTGDKDAEDKYKGELIRYVNAVKDLLRQIGIMGKLPYRNNEVDKPILVGLWYISKLKSSYDYGNDEEYMPKKLIYPVLVAIIDNKVQMAVFTNRCYSDYRKAGKDYSVKWLSYAEGLIEIANTLKAFDELNDAYAAMVKKQFVFNALQSIGELYMNREVLLFTNAQNARVHINELSSMGSIDSEFEFDSENEWFANKENTVLIRIVTGDNNETPGWIHVDCNQYPVYQSQCGGMFKLTDNIYYLINPHGDNHRYATQPKEFQTNVELSSMSVLEVGVYGELRNDVLDYIRLTKELRSRSAAINFPTAIKLPLPLHLASIAEEYVDAYYDEYFFKRFLEKKKIEKIEEPI